jgi:DNA-binding transcriptional MerR regulator
MKQADVIVISEEKLTLDAVARRAGMHPVLIEHFAHLGLIAHAERSELFDATVLPRIRLIGRLRGVLGVNVAGVSVILDLLDKLRALQRENASLRRR